MIGKVPHFKSKSLLKRAVCFCTETISQVLIVAAFFGLLFYFCPKIYSMLSFWANTPAVPTIKSCKIAQIKDTGIPNEVSVELTISIFNNFSEAQKAIAVSRDSTVEIDDYHSGMASKLSRNVYHLSLKDRQKDLVFSLRIYKADLILNDSELPEEDCFVQLHFVER